MNSGARPNEAPVNIASLRLAFEHFADAVCGIGDAVRNAREEARLPGCGICLSRRFRLNRLGNIWFLFLFPGDGIAVFHLKIAIAILWTLALPVVFCHNYHAPVRVKIDIGCAQWDLTFWHALALFSRTIARKKEYKKILDWSLIGFYAHTDLNRQATCSENAP
jgi:hypothetical protein